jgi:hypothetical protein
LSHFDNPKAKKLKAIIWSKTKAKNFSFNSDPKKSRVSSGARKDVSFIIDDEDEPVPEDQ